MNSFLKSKKLYMLFVLPFIVSAIFYFGNYLPENPVSLIQINGIINIAYINNLDKALTTIIGFVMVLGLAYLMFFINEKYKFLSQTTTLPSLIYVLLTSGIIINLGFNYLLISVFIVALAIGRLQAAINNIKSNSSIYDFGCCIMLAVAIYPKFLLLILWSICVLFFSGRSTLKDLMALIFGLLTPVYFIAVYYFWTDQLRMLPEIFLSNLMEGEFIHTLPYMEFVRLGMLLFLLLIALYNVITYYPVFVVSQRRGILSVISMLLFLSLTLFIVPGNYYDFMYILALPMSFIYAQYFITNRYRIVGNFLFLLLLVACFLTYLI